MWIYFNEASKANVIIFMSKVSKMVLYMRDWAKAVYVRDVGDGLNYIVYAMLFMLEMAQRYSNMILLITSLG